MAFFAAFLAAAESVLLAAGAAAGSACATGAAGMAGACATEVNGKPNAAADKREIKSLFMDSKVLKINEDIVALHRVQKLTRQTRCRVRERAAVRL